MKPKLRFDVNNQTIRRVDKFNVVAMSKNYLYADFNFISDDWNSANTKTALFTGNKVTKQVVLDNDDSCLVPWECLAKEGWLEVSVFGGDLITVSKAKVRVNESGYAEGSEPDPPTPDVYTQIIDKVDAIKNDVDDIQKIVIIAEDDEVDEMLDDVFNGESQQTTNPNEDSSDNSTTTLSEA